MAINFGNVKSLTIGEPYDAEIEYLEFTGSQTIPVANTGDYFDLDLQITGGASQTVFGNGTATRNRKFGTDATGHYAALGNTSSQSSPVLGSVRKTVTAYAPRSMGINVTVYVEGIAYKGETNRGSSWSTISIGGTSTLGFGSFRLYGLQGYRIVRVGATGCLYNPETGDLIYPSTGTLVCGPDVHVVERQVPVAILKGGDILWKKDTTLKTINLNGLSIPGFTCSLTGLTECSICFWARNLADFYHSPSWAESGSWGGTYVGVNGSTIEARFGTGNSNSKKQWNYVQPANEWHHYAAVRNGSTGYYYLYVDGVLVSSQTGGTLAMANSATTFTLANGFNGSIVNTDESIVAYCVFSKALTAEEVMAVKNSLANIDTSAAPFNSNLLLALPLTEGTGTTLTNVANGDTVTIASTPTWNVPFDPSSAFSFVEYLESVAGSRIVTNYYSTSNFGFVADAYIPNGSWLFISGNDYNANTMGVFGGSTGSNLVFRTPGRNNDFTGAANRRVRIAYSNGVANVDGVNYPIASFSRPPDFPQRIFNGGSVKLYSLQFYESNELKLDLQPCRVGTTGFLYDKVSGQLLGNDGTGEFAYGADVVPGSTPVTPQSARSDLAIIAAAMGVENAEEKVAKGATRLATRMTPGGKRERFLS